MGIFASTRSQDEGVQLVLREPMTSGEVSYRLNLRMGSHHLRDLRDVRKHGSYLGVLLQVLQASWRALELDPRRRVAGVEHVVPDRVGVLASPAKSKPAKTHTHARTPMRARSHANTSETLTHMQCCNTNKHMHNHKPSAHERAHKLNNPSES